MADIISTYIRNLYFKQISCSIGQTELKQSSYDRQQQRKEKRDDSTLIGNAANEALDSFRYLYSMETNSKLELEIRLKTCSTRYGESPNFTLDTFADTLKGLWNAADISAAGTCIHRYLIYSTGIDDGVSYRKITPVCVKDNMLHADGEIRLERKTRRYMIDTKEDTTRLIETYGYIPRLSISEEEIVEADPAWDKIFATLRISFNLDCVWRVDASLRVRQRMQEPSIIMKDVLAFFNNPLWKDITTPAEFVTMLQTRRAEFLAIDVVDLHVELEYIPSNGTELPILKDIELALMKVIQHGYRSKQALTKFGSITQHRRKIKLWTHLYPVVHEWNAKRAANLSKFVQDQTILFAQMIPFPSAVGLEILQDVYNNLPKFPYALSRKLSGKRAVVVIIIEKQLDGASTLGLQGHLTIECYGADFMETKELELYQPDIDALRLNIPSFDALNARSCTTIFDCELYEGVFHIIDVMQLCGEIVANRMFKPRHELLLTSTCKILFDYMDRLKIQHDLATFYDLNRENFSELMLTMFNASEKYDGVVLTPVADVYRSDCIYKFKPPHENTIDLLLKAIDPDSLISMGISPRNVVGCYIAYVTDKGTAAARAIRGIIRNNMWWNQHFPGKEEPHNNKGRIPIPFATGIAWLSHIVVLYEPFKEDLDDKIVECVWKTNPGARYPVDGRLVPVRVREDKTFEYHTGSPVYGNFHNVAYKTLISALDPITEELIREPHRLAALAEKYASPIMTGAYAEYFNILEVMQAIVYELHVKPHVDNETLIEFSNDKGYNMKRVFHAGVRRLFLISDNIASLTVYEQKLQQWLVDVKDSVAPKANLISNERPIPNKIKFDLRSIVYDLASDDISRVSEQIVMDTMYPKASMNVILFNYSIQNAFNSPRNIERIGEFCNAMLKKGGKVVFIYMDGSALFKFLNNPCKEDGVYEVDVLGCAKFYHPSQSERAGEVRYMIEALYPLTVQGFTAPGLQVRISFPTLNMPSSTEYLVSGHMIKNLFHNFKCVRDGTVIDDPIFSTAFAGVKKVTFSSRDLICEADLQYLGYTKILVLEKKKVS